MKWHFFLSSWACVSPGKNTVRLVTSSRRTGGPWRRGQRSLAENQPALTGLVDYGSKRWLFKSHRTLWWFIRWPQQIGTNLSSSKPPVGFISEPSIISTENHLPGKNTHTYFNHIFTLKPVLLIPATNKFSLRVGLQLSGSVCLACTRFNSQHCIKRN